MAAIPFTPNKTYSVGVEIEFQLLNPKTFDLTHKGPELLNAVPKKLKSNFKAEFIQSMIEVISDKCENIAQISDNLSHLCTELDTICDAFHCLPYSASLHPFATLEQRKISDNIRYHQIMDDLKLVGKRLITQGLHVHVGLPNKSSLIRVNNSIRRYLPLFLAITASSPFYLNEDTGFMSYRSKLFESLPRSGIPAYLTNWSHFEKFVHLMIKSKTIQSIREIWWDVRPHPEFGTIEIRICDLPASLNEIVAVAAIIQALVATLAQTKRTQESDFNIIINNKWQAARYGTKAKFINEHTGNLQSVKTFYDEMLADIEPQLKALSSLQYLDANKNLFNLGNPAERYHALFKKKGTHAQCIKDLQGEFWS